MMMKRILFLTTAFALASCVQQKVVVPPPATAPIAPDQPVTVTPPIAQPKPVPKHTPRPKAVPDPPAKPAAPAAVPEPLKPLRGTHSTMIQESDRVQPSRSMGGSATYVH